MEIARQPLQLFLVVHSRSRSSAFTLVELCLVIFIIAMLAVVMVGSQHFTSRVKAQETIEELNTLSTAAIKYYHKNGAMPTSLSQLQDLINGTVTNNPFGYAYSISSTSWTVTIRTTVPKNVLGYISWGKQLSVQDSGATDILSITETVNMDMIDGERYDKKNLYKQ